MITFSINSENAEFINNIFRNLKIPRSLVMVSSLSIYNELEANMFSCFQCLDAYPPICIFTITKSEFPKAEKSLQNLISQKECVIHLLDDSLLPQVVEFQKNNASVQQFFEVIPSETVKVPRLSQALIQLECVVNHIIPLGKDVECTYLVLAETKKMHVSDRLLGHQNQIVDSGVQWMTTIANGTIYNVSTELLHAHHSDSIKQLPRAIRNSNILQPNHLTLLATFAHQIPSDDEVQEVIHYQDVSSVLEATIGDVTTRETQLHHLAIQYLDKNEIHTALKILML